MIIIDCIVKDGIVIWEIINEYTIINIIKDNVIVN